MLVALLAAFLLGGGGTNISGVILTPGAVEQVGKQIEVVVTDPERAEAAAETLAELKAEIKGFEKKFAKSGKELAGHYKDHEASGASMLAVLDQLNAGWKASQQRALDLRFELRESLTEAEWVAIFGGE